MVGFKGLLAFVFAVFTATGCFAAQKNLVGSAICDGVNASPAKISIVQIWNPVGSGVDLFVTNIEVAWNATDARIAELKGLNGFDFTFNYTPIGSTITNLVDTDASNQNDSIIQLRCLQTATPYPSSRLFFEKWPGQGVLKSTPTEFSPTLKIPPGNGIMIRPAQSYTWNIVNVQGYSEPGI